ncbi:MAG: hypothetical protein ACREDL_05385 [Bradyrhizobium sp.]
MTEPADSAADTAPVTVTLLSCERVAGCGRIRAFAAVAVNVGGIELEVRGIRIVDSRDGQQTSIAPPVHRDRTGRWVPSIALPPEVDRPLGQLVAGAFVELGGKLGLELPLIATDG